MSEQETQAVTTYKQTLRRGLSARHREAMRRLASGIPAPQVAEDLGYTLDHFYKIARSPLFKREMERMQARLDQAAYNAMSELRKIHPAAVNAYRDLIEQTEYKQLRFNVAKDLLDRTGVTSPRVGISQSIVQTYEQRLSEVKQTYTVTGNEDSPIEIMGGEELLKDYDK
jgi:hypothetical protein